MSKKPDPDERASLHGLTPEEALRALMQVDPNEPADDDVSGNDKAPNE